MLAFGASYLSADAVACSVEQIVTISQGPHDPVTSYANRHRDRFKMNSQVERQQVQPPEALQIGDFDSGLFPELFERRSIGFYCKSTQEVVARAQRSAMSMVAVGGTVTVMPWSTVVRGRLRIQTREARTFKSRLERKCSRSGCRKNQGVAVYQFSKLPVLNQVHVQVR